MHSIDTILENYQELPIATVGSNEPYAVGESERAAMVRQQTKDTFLAGNEDWPELEFPLLRPSELRDAERQLLFILGEIADADTPSDEIKTIAYEQVGLKLAEVYRHLEIVRCLGSVAAKQELSRKRAGEMTLEVFGYPDKATFEQLLIIDQMKAIEAVQKSDSEERRGIAKGFLERVHLTVPLETTTRSFELEDQTIEKVRSDLLALFPKLGDFLTQDIPDMAAPQEALLYFNQALDIFDLRAKGWNTELSNGRAAETKGAKKKVFVGKNRPPFTQSTLRTVPVHEAIHAVRYQNADEQSEPIKRRSLPGNVEIEEGIGVAIEQILGGQKRTAGLAYYLSLGLQLGLDKNGVKRNFRETYEVMWRRQLLDAPTISDEAIRNAKDAAYQTVIRTTRGNSLDARDISYFEGNRRAIVWLNSIAALSEAQRRQKILIMLSGKFDPTNEQQAALFDEADKTL